MKKLLIIIVSVFLLAFPTEVLFAAELVTQHAAEQITPTMWEVKFEIQTATNGSMTATPLVRNNINRVRGMYLMQVDAFPTSGGTAPDAASVFIYDENGIYYLGSVDDGTTAYAGLNLIHATIPKSCIPNMYLTGQDAHINYYWPIRGVLTLAIADQATDTAHITIILTFVE